MSHAKISFLLVKMYCQGTLCKLGMYIPIISSSFIIYLSQPPRLSCILILFLKVLVEAYVFSFSHYYLVCFEAHFGLGLSRE